MFVFASFIRAEMARDWNLKASAFYSTQLLGDITVWKVLWGIFFGRFLKIIFSEDLLSLKDYKKCSRLMTEQYLFLAFA